MSVYVGLIYWILEFCLIIFLPKEPFMHSYWDINKCMLGRSIWQTHLPLIVETNYTWQFLFILPYSSRAQVVEEWCTMPTCGWAQVLLCLEILQLHICWCTQTIWWLFLLKKCNVRTLPRKKYGQPTWTIIQGVISSLIL